MGAAKATRPALQDAQKTMAELRNAMTQAQSTLLTVQNIIDERSPLRTNLTDALEELSAAARSIRVFAEYLERHPEALLRGKGRSGGR